MNEGNNSSEITWVAQLLWFAKDQTSKIYEKKSGLYPTTASTRTKISLLLEILYFFPLSSKGDTRILANSTLRNQTNPDFGKLAQKCNNLLI